MGTAADVDLKALNETVREEALELQAALREIRKVIVGQGALLDRLLVALLCRGHLLVEGVPGLAKTLAVKTMGEVLDLPFARIQFTPDLLPALLLGLAWGGATPAGLVAAVVVGGGVDLVLEAVRTGLPPGLEPGLAGAAVGLLVLVGVSRVTAPAAEEPREVE